MNADPYVYAEAPGVLRNLLGIKDAAELDAIERALVAQRTKERSPVGEFDAAHIHARLVQRKFLSGLARSAFAQEVASIIGDLNYVHPFREGNGRTHLQYLKQLARRAGHDVDLTKLKRDEWQEASRAAHQADYSLMAKAVAAALVVHKKGSSTRT